MKNSIKLSALFLLFSAGILGTTAAKAADHTAASKDVVTLSAMKQDRGITVNLLKANESKAYVLFMDREGNVLLKDFLPKQAEVTKGYVLTDLENGDYTIMVATKDQVVKKKVHVYEENNHKTFFFVD